MKTLIRSFTPKTILPALAVMLLAVPVAIGDMHQKDQEMMEEHMVQNAMKGKDACCKMHRMGDGMPMMQGMMHRQVVPTEDGGIVVVMGNLLIKYDAELKLVAKTRVEMSSEDMQQMMKDRQMMMEMRKDKGGE